MSAKDQLAAMLNDLMGPRRNAAPGENTKIRFEDDEVCKFFLAGYCPNALFINTKADLGHCAKSHDEELKKTYQQSGKFEQLGYEEEFISFIRRMHNDMQRKINRNLERLKLTQPDNPITEGSEEKMQKEVAELTEKINECVSKAEELGSRGKIEESQSKIEESQKYTQERDRLNLILSGAPMGTAEDDGSAKLMQVCDICGCFLIVGDAQNRIDEHYIGKQHLGFSKIKMTLEEYDKKQEERKTEKRDKRDKNRRDRDRDRGGKRHDRDDKSSSRRKSRSRERYAHSSEKNSRDRRPERRNRSRSPRDRSRRNGDKR